MNHLPIGMLKYSFGYSVPVPWYVVAVIAVVLCYLICRFYRRERGQSRRVTRRFLATTRCVIILVAFLASLNWHVKIKKYRKPTLIVLIDQSASLNHLDSISSTNWLSARLSEFEDSRPSRLNILKAYGAEHYESLESITQDFEVITIPFSDELKNRSGGDLATMIEELKADGGESNIDKAIQTVIREHSSYQPVGIVLISDGVASDDIAFVRSRSTAKAKEIPVFVVGLGSQQPAVDISLGKIRVNNQVFLNDLVEFEVPLFANGLSGESTNVELIDEKLGVKLGEKKVKITSDRFQTPIRIRSRMTQPGNREFKINAKILPQELDDSNNSQTTRVLVQDQQIRVLLVSDYPSREFHYLKQFLGRESQAIEGQPPEFSNNRIELDTYLQQGDLEYAETDRHAIKLFPVNKEQLFEYDVIIFADVKPNWAGSTAGGLGARELQNLHEYVQKRGGSLVFIAGPLYTPLTYANSPISKLFPIELSRLDQFKPSDSTGLDVEYRLSRTHLGNRTLALDLSDTVEQTKPYSELRGAYWFLSGNPKPAARVLAEFDSGGKKIPAILMQNYGSGTVLYHASPETYRWRYRTDDQYFGRYWSQMIQFLSVQKLAENAAGVTLATDRKQYYRNESVSIFATVYDRKKFPVGKSIKISVRSVAGFERESTIDRNLFKPNQYSGLVENLSPGEYSLSIIGHDQPTAIFEVLDSSRENERQPINETNLRRLASETEGEFLPIQELDQLPGLLPESELVDVGEDPPWVLWYQWQFTAIVGALLVLLVTVEWVVRKRVGMI